MNYPLTFSINNTSPKRSNFFLRGLNSRFIESMCSVHPLLNVFLSTITLTNNTSNQLPDKSGSNSSSKIPFGK